MIENINLKLSGLEPVTREDLFELVNSWGRNDGFKTYRDNIKISKCEPNEEYPLENLDVSKIDDLSNVFKYSMFNEDLSKWDTSNCTNMQLMFSYSNFDNNSLNYWNINKVNNFIDMFYNSNFSGDISSWKFNEKICCQAMFLNSNFEKKYNNGEPLYLGTKNTLKWFENNREKIREMNQGSKEEVLDFFSFDIDNLNKDIN